jgi:putative tricarboxylic transport membrane protein
MTIFCVALFQVRALGLPIPSLLGWSVIDMELLSNLALGFATALSPTNLFLGFIGCLVGTLIGVLPGIGPIAAIAMLMPHTHKVDPTGALMLPASTGAHGGSTASW